MEPLENKKIIELPKDVLIRSRRERSWTDLCRSLRADGKFHRRRGESSWLK
jgi:hypothetical protein